MMRPVLRIAQYAGHDLQDEPPNAPTSSEASAPEPFAPQELTFLNVHRVLNDTADFTTITITR